MSVAPLNTAVEEDEYVELIPYLVRAAQSIRECGWVSRASARRSGDMATADHAYDLYRNAEDEDADFHFDDPTKEDEQTALDALDYANTLLHESVEEFDTTLVTLVNSWQDDDGWIPVSDIGYASSVIGRWQRYVNWRDGDGILIQQQAARSEYQGQPGQAIKRTVRIVRRHLLKNSFGEHLLTIMEDPEGNIFVFFDRDLENTRGIEENDIYEVAGVIKRHDIVHDVKETIFASCIFKTIEGIRD